MLRNNTVESIDKRNELTILLEEIKAKNDRLKQKRIGDLQNDLLWYKNPEREFAL